MNRFLVDVYIGALEAVNGLFRVAYDKNLVENGAENIPLQLVCVLEFVDDGVVVLRTKSCLEWGFVLAFVKYGLMDRKNHVVKGLDFHIGFVFLPCIKNFWNVLGEKLLLRVGIEFFLESFFELA